ncbi:MAG: helix-turn-helix domain-containing protein [Candidatus Thorarchaeota archaeon]|jgi:predicted DNA binding protein
MIEARIEVFAEGYYSCDLTRKIPVRVDLISINGPLGFGIIRSLTGDEKPLEKYVSALESSSSTSEVRITHKSTEVYWSEVVHKLESKSIHETILDSGCMSRLPIIIEGGKQVHQLLAPNQTAFRIAFDNLRSNFKKVRLLRVHRSPKGSPHSGLTTKQMGAIKEAIKSGYYEIPRKCEVKQIAKQLGIKRVATQERLRRAERRIMNHFADEHL